jgi:hypothetical protein
MTTSETHKTRAGKPVSVTGASGKRKRRGFLAMSLGIASVAASIAVAAVLALQFAATSPRIGETSAAPAPPGATASILIHPEGGKCQSRIFDNQTGQISEGSAPCPVAPVDAKGMPVPLGTTRTINSISRSFK